MAKYSRAIALKGVLAAFAAVYGIVAIAASANALVSQQVFVEYDPTPADVFNNDEIRDGERIDDSGAPITTAIIANIAGGGFTGSGSVGPFGNLGVQADYIAAGGMVTQVVIEDTLIQNITGIAQRVTANFIIDGGEFSLFAGLGSTLTYTITIQRDFSTVWQSAAEMVTTAVGGDAADVTFFGEDIGAIVSANGTMIELPVAFGSADLGILGPGQTMSLLYQLDIVSETQVFNERTFWEYSDPLNVNGFGDFPTLTFTPVTTTSVPEPGMAAIIGLGFLTLAATRRRRRLLR